MFGSLIFSKNSDEIELVSAKRQGYFTRYLVKLQLDKNKNAPSRNCLAQLYVDDLVVDIKMTSSVFVWGHSITMWTRWGVHCAVVELNTRPNPLIISKFLQFRTFWSQTKALFIIRCTLSVESWFKTFRVQKWPYWVQNFEFLLHKITNFQGISGC